MRLALQALFLAPEADEEGAARRALLERRLRADERSAGFFRRLRAVVDDASLQAPEIFAEESFPDANVVAEYLDSQSTSEVARAYEDVCWDSPEALAEVGRCYDILNNDALNCVVAPKNCRRRLYYIAWEENCVNVAPTSENESSLFSEPFSSSEPFDSDEEKRESAEERSDAALRKTKKKREEKSGKPSKSVETVGATLAAERSLWRRAKRLTSRATLALGLGGAICFGWQILSDDKRSETFELETSKAEAVVSDASLEGDGGEEVPLRPTVISGVGVDELPATSLGESTNDALTAYETSNAEAGATKVAVLPNASEVEDFDNATNTERPRVGLGGEEPWARRPSIEIPAQNNDVFKKTNRY